MRGYCFKNSMKWARASVVLCLGRPRSLRVPNTNLDGSIKTNWKTKHKSKTI